MLTELSMFSGASVRAAQASNRHILALESDRKVFDAVLVPLRTPPPAPTQVANVEDTQISESDSDSGSPIRDIHCE